MSNQENPNKLDSDEFLKGNEFHSRLSLLVKELYDNIDKYILDEKNLGKALNEKFFSKKTIYSSNKFKLNLDEINSNSLSVENVLLEEKSEQILIKGEEDRKEQEEKIEEAKPEKKVITQIDEDEFFAEIEKNAEEDLKNVKEKNDKKKESVDNNNILEGNEQNQNEILVENVDNQKEIADYSANLLQDLSNYEREFQEKEENKNSIRDSDLGSQKNSIQKESIKNNEEFQNIFSMIDTEEVGKEGENKEEDASKREKSDKEKEKMKDVLKEEYYPIDVIEEAEKYYNLSNESKENLYPLNTFEMNNGLCIDFLKFESPKITTTLPGDITTIFSDNSNNLYICTSVGKIIKKGEKGEILMQSEKYNESITCIDVVDQIAVTGDKNGNIAIWINNSFNQVLSNVDENNKIISIKIIEIYHGKLIFIFSDIIGNFNFIQINNLSKNNSNDFKLEDIVYEYGPIYKILIIPNNDEFIKSKKQFITLILVSPQYLGIYNLYLEKNSLKQIKLVPYLHGERGKYFFDASIGFGFPPVSDLKKEKLGSEPSKNAILENNVEETSMIAISYGRCIKLYEYNSSINDEKDIKDIGFIVNDRPILRNNFITNSMIFLMDDNFDIKLINTYEFIPREFNSYKDIKIEMDFLISYESLSINNRGITGDMIDFSIGNRKIEHIIFSNKIIVNNSHIFFVSGEGCILQNISLSTYDEVLNSLCNKGEYIRMLWLLSIILNKKTNLLNRQLSIIERNYKENKKKLLDLYVLRFLVTVTIPDLQKNNELNARMLLEFMIETDTFSVSTDFFDLLNGYDLDKYVYSNLTKYIANGNLNDIVLNDYILKKYIDYYLGKNEKLLLNKILLKLNLDSLLQKDILKIISENELINPYIYTRIKNIKAGKIDYFLPVLYLDSIFKKEYLEKKNEELIKQHMTPEQLELYNAQLEEKKELMKEEIKNQLNISKEYKILIREHNMDFFNEKTFSCHEYIGHKFLWYCNKCILGKEYPNDNPMKPRNHGETAIKILAYLLNQENMKLYLEFDSYTYLNIISKFFIDEKLRKFITEDNLNYSIEEKETINYYLGDNISDIFNLNFVYSSIKEGLKDVEINRYFLKYDFYVMLCLICEKDKDFAFDQKDILDALTYFSELDINQFNEEEDTYNCHRKVENKKEKEKFRNKIEQHMINLLKYLKSRDLLTEKYANNLLKKENIIQYKNLNFYLYEKTQNYKECFEIKISQYENSSDLLSKNEIKEFFDWIKKIYDDTYQLQYSKNNIDKKGYNDNFKKLLLKYLKPLCKISAEELSKVIDKCYDSKDEKKEIIKTLGGEGGNSELQLKYLDQFFKSNQSDMIENIQEYLEFLIIELDILIKDRNKRRIKKLLMEYDILCNDDNIFKKLEKNGFYDSCIYICQRKNDVKKSIQITIKEVDQKYKNIITVLEKPNYNPIIIDIELNEMYKYFELGLDACQYKFLDKDKEEKNIDESWLDLFNKACEMKIDFYPRYENNKNNIKTQAHKKILNVIQNCIQLILGIMVDYINLNLLLEIIAKNCAKLQSIEFYTFLDKCFYSFRRTERILKYGEHLNAISILIKFDDIRHMKTIGKNIYLEEDKCDFCKFSLKSSANMSFMMFFCGHKYHIGCTKLENNKNVCYVCRMNEIGDDNEKIKELKNANNIVINVENNEEEKEELEKKLKEKERRAKNKKKLNALKKLKKKRKEVDIFLRSNDLYD